MLSNRIADAEIVYVGAGEIADSGRQLAEPHDAGHIPTLDCYCWECFRPNAENRSLLL